MKAQTVREGWPPFYRWQLAHAERHDPRRYRRLRGRWLYRRLQAMAEEWAAAGHKLESGARTLAQQLALRSDRTARSRHVQPPTIDLGFQGLKLPTQIRWATDLPPIPVRPGEPWHFETGAPRTGNRRARRHG